jgi:hypothetical protein
MTDIEAKALALVNEVRRERNALPFRPFKRRDYAAIEAICRAIEAHEAYKQKVSDAMVATSEYLEVCGCGPSHSELQRIAEFIILEPDPLVVAYHDALPETAAIHGKETVTHICGLINAALEAHGFEIREKE